MTTYIPVFHCRILFYYKYRGFAKKLDLNILKIDWAMVILSLKNISEFVLEILTHITHWGKLVYLWQFLGCPQTFFSTWWLTNPFNYKLVNNGSMSLSNRWSETPWVIGLSNVDWHANLGWPGNTDCHSNPADMIRKWYFLLWIKVCFKDKILFRQSNTTCWYRLTW